MKKMQWVKVGKFAALLLAVVLLCAPLLSGKLSQAIGQTAEAPEEATSAETTEEAAEKAVVPGAYDEDVYMLVGFSAEEAKQYHAVGSEQVDETVLKRLLYLEDFHYELYELRNHITEVDFSDPEILAAVDTHYKMHFGGYTPDQQDPIMDIIRFNLETRFMTVEEKVDLSYRRQGFDGTEGYMAYLKSQEATPEENARKLHEEAEKMREELALWGIDTSGMTDEEVVNP